PRSGRRCRSCSSPARRTSSTVPCRSGIATAASATASRSNRRSTRSLTPLPAASTSRRPQSCMADEPAGGPSIEPATDFAGEPDGFGRLWTPHRLAYIKGENKPRNGEAGEDCPFCTAPSRPDAESLIVARGALVYAVLNLYPYNSGHLMVVP